MFLSQEEDDNAASYIVTTSRQVEEEMHSKELPRPKRESGGCKALEMVHVEV